MECSLHSTASKLETANTRIEKEMRSSYIVVLICCTVAQGNEDLFNYVATTGNDYGPEDWNEVSCDIPGECPGWPDGWELGIGWELSTNKCKWCPEGTDHGCGLHRQSPIDLLRSESTTGHDTEW